MRLILIVAATIVGMYGIDKFLAGQERKELRADGQRLFAQGEQLLRAGKPHDAAVSFGRAHALDRLNGDYEIALASAELADGEIDRARHTLDDVLEADSNDARANLLMARAMAEQQRWSDADSYYHRAMYGAWPAHAERERAAARMELAALLAERGNKEELLSELLLIQNDSGTDKSKLAALFLQAGSTARAADVYHAMLRQNPEDAQALAGDAQAEMQRGNYGAARVALRAALRIRSDDAALRSQEQMVGRLANLDPTPRRLSTAEKYSRSREILTMVSDELRACAPDAAPMAAAPKPKAITNELSESVLADAERLWRARNDACKQAPEPFDPLPLLMKKLSQ
jgi:tetratricopeptide (TPR) repeat protein